MRCSYAMSVAQRAMVWIVKQTNYSINYYKRDLLTGLSCRYGKNPWTECDTKTNTRSRTLTLKKGDPACDPTRTIQKKCKKGA